MNTNSVARLKRAAEISDRTAELETAIEAARETEELRSRALTMALGHYRKINWTGRPEKIIEMAEAFFNYIAYGKG